MTLRFIKTSPFNDLKGAIIFYREVSWISNPRFSVYGHSLLAAIEGPIFFSGPKGIPKFFEGQRGGTKFIFSILFAPSAQYITAPSIVCVMGMFSHQGDQNFFTKSKGDQNLSRKTKEGTRKNWWVVPSY